MSNKISVRFSLKFSVKKLTTLFPASLLTLLLTLVKIKGQKQLQHIHFDFSSSKITTDPHRGTVSSIVLRHRQ